MVTHLNPGTRMSDAVVCNGVIYLAGQVAKASKGQSAAEQTREILANIDRLLREAGATETRLLQATLFVTDFADFPEINLAWENWMKDKKPPGRATVKAELADPGWKIEIVATAAL